MVAVPAYSGMSEERVEAYPSQNSMTMPIIENEDAIPSCCYGCGGKILDRYYLLAVEKQWHAGCLKCADCHLQLDSELTCFAKDGNIYCKEDYYRRFAIRRCSRCLMGISANELVMRARDSVYHLNCFTCASCNCPLTTGDQFGMQDEVVYCRSHYELLIRGEFLPDTLVDTGYDPNTPEIPYYNGVGGPQKGRPRKRKSPIIPEGDTCPPGLGLDDPDSLDQYSQGGGPRQKRMRTSFKHHQLRTMKSYFALNHNPDAKDLKQLAQKTGLTKRVLQVWFQNARAKYRRNILRQDGQGGQPSSNEKTMSESGQSDLSNVRSPGGLSDVSSSASLTDLHHQHLEEEDSHSDLSEIFTSSVSAIG